MRPQIASPHITHISWGKIEVDGTTRFKEAKCFPSGSRAWD